MKSSEPVECETCQGNGRVTEICKVVTDARTRWQRNPDYECQVECPDCNGEGKVAEISREQDEASEHLIANQHTTKD